MRVFLSGKMDMAAGSWRDEILGRDLRTTTEPPYHEWLSRWLLEWPVDEDAVGLCDWPIRRGCVLDSHDYVGPYAQTVADGSWKYLGESHGVVTRGAHAQIDEAMRPHISSWCLASIRRADLVFAYINTADAYGSLVELGYAAALGKYVSVIVNRDAAFNWDDFWFIEAIADDVGRMPWPGGGYAKPDVQQERWIVRDALKDAFVRYAARPPRPSPVPIPTEHYHRAVQEVQEAATAFDQIAQWTADPRVRNEARRMARRLSS